MPKKLTNEPRQDERLTLAVTKEFVEKVEILARLHGTNRADFIKKLIEKCFYENREVISKFMAAQEELRKKMNIGGTANNAAADDETSKQAQIPNSSKATMPLVGKQSTEGFKAMVLNQRAIEQRGDTLDLE